jgi:hypothetical protein
MFVGTWPSLNAPQYKYISASYTNLQLCHG